MAKFEIFATQPSYFLFRRFHYLSGLPHEARSNQHARLRSQARNIGFAPLAGWEYSSTVLLWLRRATQQDNRLSEEWQLPERRSIRTEAGECRIRDRAARLNALHVKAG